MVLAGAARRPPTQPLPDGAVSVQLGAPNMADVGLVGQAVTRAFAALGVKPRRVALVVPDGVARVSLLKFAQLPAQPHEVLTHRQHVGEDLARVMEVGEAVDHGHRRRRGHVRDVLVREGADHDAVDVARQHAGGVGDRLAASQLDVAWRQEQRMAAELVRADLERHARARRGLHEDHRERLPRERLLVVLAGLHAVGKVEQGDDLFLGEVRNLQEIAMHSVLGGRCAAGEVLGAAPRRCDYRM